MIWKHAYYMHICVGIPPYSCYNEIDIIIH